MAQRHEAQRGDSSARNNAEATNWWLRLLLWREKHIPDKTFVVLLALSMIVRSVRMEEDAHA